MSENILTPSFDITYRLIQAFIIDTKAYMLIKFIESIVKHLQPKFHCSRTDCLRSRMFMLGDPYPGHVHNKAQEYVYFIESPDGQVK